LSQFPVQRPESNTHREVNYILMRMQRLKKANGKKIAKLLDVVTSCSCISYLDEQTAFLGCFEIMGQIYPSGKQVHFFAGMVLHMCRCQQEHNLCLHVLNSKSL